MRLLIPVLMACTTFFSYGQKFKRVTFNYEKLKTENFGGCEDSINLLLDKSYTEIQQNNSAAAVKSAQSVYDRKKDCYEVYDATGYALFRNGQWLEGVDIIEAGIKKFGSVPPLIERRYKMSIEMAQLGTGRKEVDGNTVFSKANALKYDEEQFIAANFRSALLDLHYLIKTYNREEEIYYAAKIHQILKEYDQSNTYFRKLLNNEAFGLDASFNLSDNYLSQNKLAEAENELEQLLKTHVKEGVIYEKLAEVYEKKGDQTKAEEYRKKAVYYKNVPDFLSLDYSSENYDLLLFFGTNKHSSGEKLSKLQAISEAGNPDYTTDVCLMILKLHANHGNGVEEQATQLLSQIGKPCIEKVNTLFGYEVSTCTITNLAEVMASAKEESSWELMKAYLPTIANMPVTLTPPDLPAMMLLFDEDRGMKEILLVVKPLLTAKKEPKSSSNPLAELSGFGQYVYYYPLEKIDPEKLNKTAKELGYSDEELNLLKGKIRRK